MSKSVRNILIIFISAVLLIGLIFGIKCLKKDNSKVDNDSEIITFKEKEDDLKKDKIKKIEKTDKVSDSIDNEKKDNSTNKNSDNSISDSSNNTSSSVSSTKNNNDNLNSNKNTKKNASKKTNIINNDNKNTSEKTDSKEVNNNKNEDEKVNTKISTNSQIEKTIKDYDLEKYREVILNNEELFIKYSLAVESNANLGKGKKYVYDMFIVVADQKQYIEDEIFYERLSTLKFLYSNEENSGGKLGEYKVYTNEVIIYCDESKQRGTIYHELMHFIDFNLNSNKAKDLYMYEGKYISKDKYYRLLLESNDNDVYFIDGSIDCDEIAGAWSVFLSESGAELYSKKYFGDSVAESYSDSVNLFHILQYIYTEEKIEEVYFGTGNLYQMTNGYFTEAEFKEFLNTAYAITYYKSTATKNDYNYLFDTMIGLYINSKGKDWYNDREFCYLLYNFVEYRKEWFENSKYLDTFNAKYDYFEKLDKSLSDSFEGLLGTKHYYYPNVIFENGSVILVTYTDKYDDNAMVYKFKYNPKDNTIKEIYRGKRLNKMGK